MPPRKRAAVKPDPPAAPEVDGTLPADTPTSTAADPGDAAPAVDEPQLDAPAPADNKPKKSDLQDVEQPCPICFPNGWAASAFSHGCEHGTWIRDNT